MAGRFALVLLTSAIACAALTLSSPDAMAVGDSRGTQGNAQQQGSMPSASQSSSRDPAQAYQLGIAAMQAQQYDDAIRNFRVAQRAVGQNDPNVNYQIGLAYVGKNDNERARDPLERAARAPNPPLGAIGQLGLVYVRLGDRTKATETQTRLTTMLAACDATCGDARRSQIQAQLDTLNLALNPPAATPAAAPTTGWNFPSVEEGRQAYAEAVGLVNQQRYSQALDALNRAQAALGPDPNVLNYMGFASRRLGRTDEALAYYRQALRINPEHRGANEYLGELYIQMGRMDDARRQLARLDGLCAYGCEEREELARWIQQASKD